MRKPYTPPRYKQPSKLKPKDENRIKAEDIISELVQQRSKQRRDEERRKWQLPSNAIKTLKLPAPANREVANRSDQD